MEENFHDTEVRQHLFRDEYINYPAQLTAVVSHGRLNHDRFWFIRKETCNMNGGAIIHEMK